MEKLLKGKVIEIKDKEVIIKVDGKLKTFYNNSFHLKIGEEIKFELDYINQIHKVVIYDKKIY